MSDTFTREEIEALASLAQLELSEREVSRIGRQLDAVLGYARHVQQIDTTGVPPTASVVVAHQAERDDVVCPSLDRRDALANAPDGSTTAGVFRVPRVIG